MRDWEWINLIAILRKQRNQMANSSAEEEREIEVGILLLVVRWWMVV